VECRKNLRPVAASFGIDALTGLANATAFQHALQEASERGNRAHVFLIDLVGFKLINDRFGHESGDVVLCEVAERLRRSFGDSGLVARIGGGGVARLLGHPGGGAARPPTAPPAGPPRPPAPLPPPPPLPS